MGKKAQRRSDGYANMLNKYGTSQDNSTAYRFQSEGPVPDTLLTEHYEENGLFAKIIDAPAEEAIKHGFELDTDNPDAAQLLDDALDALEWTEKAATAIKWARLYGGAVIVMLIDDGHGLEEPLDRVGLADLMTSEAGEDIVLRRMQLIDKARGILNSMAIDADGESYDFKSVTFAGVKDIIDTTCNMLSAVTSIPQTILFGRSPAGMNATGQGDLENFYNLCERIQKMMLYGNLKTLAEIIFAAAYAKGDLPKKPPVKIKFNPLWSLSETEQATVEQTRATVSQIKAQTAQIYVDMGALDAQEVRRGLAADGDFDIEKMLDDLPEEDLLAKWNDYPAPTDAENPGAQGGDPS